ncbi:MAG: transglycosylase family protein, partial [Mycobacterium sp.]
MKTVRKTLIMAGIAGALVAAPTAPFVTTAYAEGEAWDVNAALGTVPGAPAPEELAPAPDELAPAPEAAAPEAPAPAPEEPAPAPEAPPAPRKAYSVNWDAIAACESGGNRSISSGNAYSGGLQFTP